ncbi:MAG TPA: multiheme c-type cytochrome [Kofleriaceae bacterium]|jgi:hypothetical protein
MKRILILAILLAACGDDGSTLTPEQLQDPSTCMQCHPQHYMEWSSSMHAYASVDPVFVAMNQRGQRETNGELGTFCLQCHAPMAVALNQTNGTDFDPTKLTPQTTGITCYFCHSVKDVVADHNNGLELYPDNVTMYGGAPKPASNSAHHSDYTAMMDSDVNDSSMCGSCHDVVTPEHGISLERTFAEWKTTFFSTSNNQELHLSCGSCHMKSKSDLIADDPDANVTLRDHGYHEHLWPAVDQAFTAFPNPDLLSGRIQEDLDNALTIIGVRNLDGTAGGGICLNPDGTLTVRMDTVSVAHAWPSGAAQDRRAWLEVTAYDTSGNVVFTSGVTPDGMDPEDVVYSGSPDVAPPAKALLWDRTWKDTAMTMPADFFWEVQAEDPSFLLRPPVTNDPTSPLLDHSTTATWTLGGALENQIDKIDARIRLRPFGYAILDQLISSGDLDASYRDKNTTLDTGGTNREWTRATMGVDRCNPF